MGKGYDDDADNVRNQVSTCRCVSLQTPSLAVLRKEVK